MNGLLSPDEIARKSVEICKKKSELAFVPLLVLGILAGLYIGFGAEVYLMVSHDLAERMGIGFMRFLRGSVFTVGLMLVVIAGAELFTGNCLMVIGVWTHRISWKKLLRNWGIVYLANFIGSIFLAILIFYSGQWKFGDLGVATEVLSTCVRKVTLPFVEAFCRGVACNCLVCLAVWMATAGKDVAGKLLAVYFPIMTFVASAFEHSIANMYILALGLLLKGNPEAVAASGLGVQLESLNLHNFLFVNLLPVTLGNIIGGALIIGGAYYLAYLRSDSHFALNAPI
jgi:formate/nitrite transporter